MSKRLLPYSAVPTVVLALATVASLGTVMDVNAATAAICDQPAALLTAEAGCGAVNRSTSFKLAEAARHFRGQPVTLLACVRCFGTPAPALASMLPLTDLFHPDGLCLVNPRLTNLPPPLA